MLTRGLRAYAELTGNKRAAIITSDDVMISAAGMLSVFIREPEFVGQTKDRLATIEAIRIVETGRSATRSTIGWPTIRRKPRSCSNG